eukprot:3032868-Amphidinium_carterae.1
MVGLTGNSAMLAWVLIGLLFLSICSLCIWTWRTCAPCLARAAFVSPWPPMCQAEGAASYDDGLPQEPSGFSSVPEILEHSDDSDERSRDEPQSTPYLCLSTARAHVFVCVTTSPEKLRSACADKRLVCSLEVASREQLVGEVGEVLKLEQIDELAWVAFRDQGLQGWFPLACLREVDVPALAPGDLEEPDLETINKVGMIALPWNTASSVLQPGSTLQLATTDRNQIVGSEGSIL